MMTSQKLIIKKLVTFGYIFECNFVTGCFLWFLRTEWNYQLVKKCLRLHFPEYTHSQTENQNMVKKLLITSDILEEA
jgi:hypothetical protein